MPVASTKPAADMSSIERNKASAKAADEILAAPNAAEAMTLFRGLDAALRNDRVVKALAEVIDKELVDPEMPEAEPKPTSNPRRAASEPNAPKVAGAFVSNSDAVEATINSAGQKFGLESIDSLDEIDEATDLPPGVAAVKMIDGVPIVYWQLAKVNYHRHPRKRYSIPILRINPHFAHLPDSDFDVFNHLTNGDLIVCYTSEKRAREYHIAKRRSVDKRNEFMYEGGAKKRESEQVNGQQIRASYQQGVTIDSEHEAVFDRAAGRRR